MLTLPRCVLTPAQVYVNPTQVCVNPAQVSRDSTPAPSSRAPSAEPSSSSRVVSPDPEVRLRTSPELASSLQARASPLPLSLPLTPPAVLEAAAAGIISPCSLFAHARCASRPRALFSLCLRRSISLSLSPSLSSLTHWRLRALRTQQKLKAELEQKSAKLATEQVCGAPSLAYAFLHVSPVVSTSMKLPHHCSCGAPLPGGAGGHARQPSEREPGVTAIVGCESRELTGIHSS
jgi:hypothetical protein